jgi:hypothetical protein
MAQRNSRASVGGDEDFPSPLAPDQGATALDLVNQAADAFRSMEKHSRESDARAQLLCASAWERLRLAEVQAEVAERGQRELIVTSERKLQRACRALEQAQSCIVAQKDKLTAVEVRAEAAEAETRQAKEALVLVERLFASICVAQTRMPTAG